VLGEGRSRGDERVLQGQAQVGCSQVNHVKLLDSFLDIGSITKREDSEYFGGLAAEILTSPHS
jgi:hypothetical protein